MQEKCICDDNRFHHAQSQWFGASDPTKPWTVGRWRTCGRCHRIWNEAIEEPKQS
jgi:hypothetical protein